ncbi:unnamed protein product [Acanthoscelides obtectus]|uniref:Uncharacterized protein n=1 Tax=Acanthoscelides obtectus TaxID=200917 RepID=A0A9P0PRF5_ACAOB|nr:unnamed protein product [Acanthoscelides obtectus]CAK1624130.1 hypothetical protein AOBTE_LOCUS2340 [Acanthoscelides obtectus]
MDLELQKMDNAGEGHLISNDLAVSYRYLGTRQDKKAFKASVFIKVVLVIKLSSLVAAMEVDRINLRLLLRPHPHDVC